MYYFIINPSASSGRGKKLWYTLKKELDDKGISYRAAFTKKSGDASRLAKKASLRIINAKSPTLHQDVIVAVGGDGTANEVLNGLCLSEKIRFGYIPTGSGNDLARGLKLQTEPLKALDIILHPSIITPVRVGVVTTATEMTHRFFISCGMGYDASVCHEALHSSVKNFLNQFGLGKLSYTSIALKQLLLLKGVPVTLTLDDAPAHFFDSVLFIAIMNLPYEGGGFMFCPDADSSDEYLDICVVEDMPKPEALCLIPTAFSGKHVRSEKVHIYRCKKAVLEAENLMCVHADGESLDERLYLEAALEPVALPFITG